LPKVKSNKPKKLTFEELLLKIDLEELRSFVRDQHQGNRDFGNKFLLFFAEKDPSIDIAAKYEGMLHQLVRQHSSRGFMDYRSTFAFSKEVQPILDIASKALGQQNFRDGLVIVQASCKIGLDVIQNCDDSAGNVSGILFQGIEVLGHIAQSKTVSPELLEQLYAYLDKSLRVKTWFGYGDFGYEMLKVAESIALRIEPASFLGLLDHLMKTHVDKYDEYTQARLKIIKIRILESLGRTKEAEIMVAEHMDVVEIRQGVVQMALEQKDFQKAKRLIAEGVQIAEAKKNPGTVQQWEEKLLEIAQLEGDLILLRHFAKKFAFDRGHVTAKYYQLWKASFPASEWPITIEQYIQSVIFNEKADKNRSSWLPLDQVLFRRLSPILILEEQWERLLKLLPKTPDEHLLASIHPYLAKRYPREMLGFYLPILKVSGDKSSNRGEYQELAKLMKKVKQDIEGSHVAIDELAGQLIQTYVRRPAMLEELGKVLGKGKARI